jgi:sugar phosphate isomerase/epimerase
LHTQGEGLILEIKKLGFHEVELNFKLTPTIVAQIGSLVKKDLIKVESLHNYCPIPESMEIEKALPDCFSMASLDELERQTAVKQTKITIDTAADLGAKAVVLHCGRVEINDHTLDLITLYNTGNKNTKKYAQLKSEMVKKRDGKASAYFANALRSIDELNRYAEAKNMALGIENRFYFREIPNFEEIGKILNKFKRSQVFFWHDTGHAQVLENLGIGNHEDYLKEYSRNMIGMHLHDVLGTRDHLAPHQGDFDFTRLTPYINKQTLKVIEAHRPAGGKDIIKSKEYLETVFNERI